MNNIIDSATGEEFQLVGTLPNMVAYESLKDMVRTASVAQTAYLEMPPTAEQLWEIIQAIITGVKGQLDTNEHLTVEQTQYYCTLDQIQADLAHELGISTDVTPLKA